MEIQEINESGGLSSEEEFMRGVVEMCEKLEVRERLTLLNKLYCFANDQIEEIVEDDYTED